MDKHKLRQRRAKKTRMKIRELAVPRLTVHRTPRHIYAQVVSPENDKVIASASTLDKTLSKLKSKGNIEAAQKVGTLIAERAKDNKVDMVAFDRSGYKYHGRIKALAEAARTKGLKF